MSVRKVLVTGASSGIGRALSLEFASRGGHVAIVARRKSELDALASEIKDKGGRAVPIAVDVSDAKATQEAVRHAHGELGGLDMVVANAGIGHFAPASTMTWEDLERVINVNIRGTMATIHAAIGFFVAQKSGHIVATTSLAGQRGLPHHGPYCASKAAISTFLESCRQDLGAHGIRVTDVQPGYVDTAMTQDLPNKPMMWPAARAARHIVNHLETGPSVIAFPWPLAVSTRLSRSMPEWLFDPVARMSMGLGKEN
jgi:NAD(P)-dependent dehydrogenase (short-subunit alcohol dehydrogenase family)